jgi:anti-anti-sigma factor
MTKLSIDISEGKTATVLTLRGELIGPELAQLQRVCVNALQQLESGELVIDMANVVYIDSLSIGRLIALNGAAEKQGKRLVLAQPKSRVLETLKILNIDKLIAVR